MNKKLFLAATILSTFFISISHAQVPADSAYKKDPQTRFSKDFLNSNFDNPNVISCFLSKAGIREMVGRGKYYALVDGEQCENENVGVQDTGSGSKPTDPKYLDMMVESYIENNSLKAKLWLSFPDDYSANTYQTFVAASIDESETDKPPYGKWRVDFCDTLSSAPSSCVMFGFVNLDGQNVTSLDKNADNSWAQRGVAVVGSRQNSNGIGKFEVIENGTPLTASFQSGDSYYRARFSGSLNEDLCYSPSVSASGARFAMWDTYLYDAQTGAKIDTFGGMRIKRESSTSYEGYASFWGVGWWSNSGVNESNISSGSRVIGEKGPNGENQVTAYEYIKSSGRLKKYTVANKTLSQFAGREFMAWINVTSLATSSLKTELINASAVYPNLRIKWNQSTSKFEVSGFRHWIVVNGNSVERNITFSSPFTFTIQQLVDTLNSESIGGWFVGTNTSLRIQLANPLWTNGSYSRVPIAQSDISVREESSQVVMPGEISSTTMYCTGQCFKPDNSIGNPTSIGDAKVSNLYYWDGASADLKFTNSSGNPVAVNSGWYGSSKLLTSLSDLEKLGCDPAVTNDSETVCPWNDSQLTNWYQWESGENNWNRQQFLKVLNSNTYVNFSSPLQLTYQVPNQPSNGSYAGQQASIQYPGAGQLWIPGKCVNRLRLTEEACGSGTGWVHDFVIPTTESASGKVTLADGSREYLVKWLSMGVYFAPFASSSVEENACRAELPLTGVDAMTLPSDSDFRNPASPDSPNYIGPWVNVSGSPAVIHGKLQ
jgi:hypothetical protein